MKISGTAFAGYISNGGLPGDAYGSTVDCWSAYFEFGGVGQVDFQAQSAMPGAPDYVIHFIVHDRP